MRRGVPGVPVPMRWTRLDLPREARTAAAAMYLATLTGLLLAPSSSFEGVGGLIAGADKVVHVLLFLALALLARWSLPAAWGAGWRRAVALAALAGYAGSMEGLQPLLTHGDRQFEWLDLASNAVGVGGGWLLLGALAAADTPKAAGGAGPAAAPGREPRGRRGAEERRAVP